MVFGKLDESQVNCIDYSFLLDIFQFPFFVTK